MPEALTRDVVHGIRMLAKSPGVTLAALISLMLAIRDQVSFTDAEDFRRSRSLAGLSVFMDWMPALTGSGEPERIPAMQVGDGYFEVLKTKALLGRTFLPEEQQEGKDFVVVLSHGLWQRRFGGDPRIVGKTLTLNSRSYTVVGVMPPELQSLPAPGLVSRPAELYRPVAERYADKDRDSRHLRALARLAPGATIEGVQAELAAVAARLAREFPESNTNRSVHVVSLRCGDRHGPGSGGLCGAPDPLGVAPRRGRSRVRGRGASDPESLAPLGPVRHRRRADRLL